MRFASKFWRESASVIALAKNGRESIKSQSNYKILLQQRSGTSGFLPKTIVFPGGTTEEHDYNRAWYDHFKDFGIENDKYSQFQSKNILLPPIFNDDVSPLNRHVSLRITAIRETFEELGLLICRKRDDNPMNKYAAFISDFDIKHWQEKIYNDPIEFISLCQHLDCYPDIWSLYLWCDWLTPIGYGNQRFDTIFFLTAFENTPQVFADDSEVSRVWWSSPEDVMNSYKEKKLLLPPPQWYELSKLNHQKDIDALVNFSAERSSLGCEQIYPILVHPKRGKGWLALFPGDELYPDAPDFEKQSIIHLDDKTIDELQESANITHRMEIHNLYTIKAHLKNYSPVQSQLSPINAKIPKIIMDI